MNEERKIKIEKIESQFDNHQKIEDCLKRLTILREAMWNCNAIGLDIETNIAYGNISARLDNKRFLCTATKTSALRKLRPNNYTIVEDYSEKNNVLLYSSNEAEPSVEASTHDGIYRGNNEINCIAHGHLQDIYFNYINNKNGALILDNVEYGSPELRKLSIEQSKLALNHELEEQIYWKGKYGIIIPKQHFNSFFITGKSIEDTLQGFLITFRNSLNNMLNNVNKEFSR